MINEESIEQEYNLERVHSTRGKQVITQSRVYIFYYQYTKKQTNKSKYDNIINIINYNNVPINNLRLRYENNIIDFN